MLLEVQAQNLCSKATRFQGFVLFILILLRYILRY